MTNNNKTEELKLKIFTQNTSINDWHSLGLADNSCFFYLLHWKSMGLSKFGYKFSAESFKDDYGKYNHTTPDYSKIWLVVGAEVQTKPVLTNLNSLQLRKYIPFYEEITHKNLKLNYKKLKPYKEVYFSEQPREMEKYINESLSTFGIYSYTEFVKERNKISKDNFDKYIKPW